MKIIKLILATLLGLGPLVAFSILGLAIYASSQNLSGIIGAIVVGIIGIYIGYFVAKISLKTGIINFMTIGNASPDLDHLN
ncbi:MAG: hypothetical protein ACERKD_16035 [Prolixibacteraceae bacterium]